MRLVLLILVGCICLPGLARAQADRVRISSIRVVGNEVTNAKIILQELPFRVGQTLDAKHLEKGRQAVMNLKLFKKVEFRLLAEAEDSDSMDEAALMPDLSEAPDRILEIEVDEKYFLLPVPRINRNADGDIKYGVQLRWDNILGLNQTVKLTAERKEYGDATLNPKNSVEFEYLYPRIVGTPYLLDIRFDDTTTQVDELGLSGTPSVYDEHVRSSRFSVGRYLERKGPSEGWHYRIGLSRSDVEYAWVSGDTDLLQDRTLVSFVGRLDNEKVKELDFSRHGVAYGYETSIGLTGLGSDEEYSSHDFYYRLYQPVFDKPHQNLNIQFRFGFSNYSSGETYLLGDSSRLRGYEREDVTGNAFVLLNMEYLFPVFDYYPFRLVLFGDIGNAYKNVRAIDLGELESGFGAGFRWKVRSLVNTDLRLDVAYGLGSGLTKVYAGTHHNF